MSALGTLGKLARMLHPLERAVLPLTQECSTFSEIVVKSGLKDVEVMRALEWLENKRLVLVEKKIEKMVVLGKNGETYKNSGLPEQRLLSVITEKPTALDSAMSSASLTSEELSAAIGSLRRNNALSFSRQNGENTIAITPTGKILSKKETPQASLLRKKFPVSYSSLSREEKSAVSELESRKDIILLKDDKEWSVTQTSLGKELIANGLGSEELLGSITAQMLRTGSWKGREFRPYDTSAGVPPLNLGRKHIVTSAVDYIRRIWLDMGFREMGGRMIQTAFWDLDALFVPQDHPARDMQDTFYLTSPSHGNLPKISSKIKAVHENGGNTGSKGWGYTWNASEAMQLLLRTHTTVLSAQTLASLKRSEIPAKFFSVGKVFRNETLDWKHLFEFYQTDCIVVDPDANLKHLKGYLREFYSKIGYPDVRIRPAHFPYTEPSCEVEVFHPVKKAWIELGGAGIFRPEVVIPLIGEDIPVLAWGLGLDRIISSYYSITDIRELYSNGIKQLRDAKLWIR